MSRTVKRLALATAVAAAVAAGALTAVSLSGGSTDGYGGLSPQKVAELRELGVTPKAYTEHLRRVASYSAALRTEPPPDPKVVAPRFIRENYESQFAAWRSYRASRLGTSVEERWTTEVISETRTIAALQLTAPGNRDIGGVARWALNFALTRPLTEKEQELLNGPHGVEALDAEARRLSSFPTPRRGEHLPVRIFADEALSPGNHELIVSVFAAGLYEPNLIVRDNVWDEALSRGQVLAKRTPQGLFTLALAPSAKFYEQNLGHGRAGPVRPSSVYRLAQLFKSGPVYLLLGWSTGAKKLSSLLRRPIQEVVILPQ